MKFLKSYHWIDLPLNLAVLAVYLGIANLGLEFSMMESSATIFWPAAGFALAVTLLAGPKYIPGIFGGALAVELMIGSAPTYSVMTAFGNTFETILAYWLLMYFRPINLSLERLSDLFKLLIYGAVISSLISAVIGPLSLVILEHIEPSLLPGIALRWWMGDAIGIALVTPLILLFYQSHQRLENKLSLELLALFFLTILMGQIVLFHWIIPASSLDLSVAWIFPFIIWSGLRAGRRYTSLLAFIICLQALWVASHGIGHYANDMQESGLLNSWIFGMLIAVGGMAMAVITAENLKRLNEAKTTAIKLLEKEERLSLATVSNGVGIWDLYPQTEKLIWDDSMFALFHIQKEDFSGAYDAWVSSLHPDDREQADRELQTALSGGKSFDTDFRVIWPNGEIRNIKGVANIFRDETGKPVRMLGINADITEQKQAELRNKFRSHVLELITNDEPLPEILEAIVLGAELEDPAMLCSILLLDETGKHLLTGSAPSLPDFYNAAINGVEIGEGVGSCGTAAFINERVIVEDIQADPYWERYKVLADKAGLGACWSQPIRSAQGKVLGTFAIYHHKITQPTEANIALIEQAAGLASIAIEKIQTKLTLQFSEERFSLAMQGANDGLWDWNMKTNEVYYSPRWKSMLGYTENEVKDDFSEWERLVHPDDKEATLIKVGELLNYKTQNYESEFRMRGKSGKYINILSRAFAVEDDAGQIIRLVGTHVDITERKKAEEKLKLSSRVFSDTQEGIFMTDANIMIVDVNPAFCKITAYSREEVLGQNPSILSSDKQSPEFYHNMWQIINENGHWQGEVWNRKKNGEVYAELLSVSVLKDELDNAVNYVGVFTDITSSKKQQERLSLMAHYDVLTGLPNRALFVDRFTQAIAHSKRTKHQLAVCFLDLDNFKPVNDNHGHEVGDKLLIEVAKRITVNIREEDTVSRQGGDEFALLLNDIESIAQCEQTLQRIHHALAQPYIIDDTAHKITASSGVTLYPDDDGDIDTLLRHADQAMYQAKLAGKHRYHLFNPEHDQRTIQKHHQLEEIEQALANNEFQLFYQPKVNMVSGKVFGAEALIRWFHPEKGLIPPLEFLPAIEGTELEIKVGDWVISEALQQLEIWCKQDIDIEVSVNIASHHLLSKTFSTDLDTVLARHPAVDPKHLQLEILESSALGDLNAISTTIETCQGALGVKVALDDFGTGYSSLTHLRSLPVDTIKIDQSFVLDMLDDPSDSAIIDSVIGLAESFDRQVIAEGVETTNHGLMLLIMGCETAQGYGIARPMPADHFPQWLSSYTPNQEWQHLGNKYRTAKENKVKLFKLTSNHWKDHFINNIQSSAEEVEHWPILDSKHCHCGTWIKQAKQKQLFEVEGLKQLSDVHDALHLIAQTHHAQYCDGDVDGARKGLAEFQTAFDDMNYALALCE